MSIKRMKNGQEYRLIRVYVDKIVHPFSRDSMEIMLDHSREEYDTFKVFKCIKCNTYYDCKPCLFKCGCKEHFNDGEAEGDTI